MRFRHALASLLAALVTAAAARAEPTRIEVRVLSQGAKFVGTSMGGVQLYAYDPANGTTGLDRTTFVVEPGQ
jgi:hypothetical protein